MLASFAVLFLLASCADLQLRDGERELQLQLHATDVKPVDRTADLTFMRYKLYQSIASTQDAITFTARADGWIEELDVIVSPTSVADGNEVEWEISFLESPQFNTNETTAVLAYGRTFTEATTAGSLVVGDRQLFKLNNPVRIEAGEKLYFHAKSSAATTEFTCFLDIKESSNVQRKTYRR